MNIYIVSDVVQVGAVWPQQPIYDDITRSDRLQEREGLYGVSIYQCNLPVRDW
jgi:hypothetical protein